MRLREGRTQSRAPAASGAPRGPPGRVSLAISGVLSPLPPARRCRGDSCPCYLPRASRGLIPGALGRRRPSLCANLRTPPPRARPSRPRSATRTQGAERDCGDSAPCVAGRGRGAGAPPAPGMRARALASTFSLPLSRVEPPLAYSGERECTDQQYPGRAPAPGTPGNVSREARKLLRVSPRPLGSPRPAEVPWHLSVGCCLSSFCLPRATGENHSL